MKNYTVTDVWEPPDNKPWSFPGDKGETVTLITYYLTVDEEGGPGGVKCRQHKKPESDKPKVGDVLSGKLVQKTSKAGKEYLKLEVSQAFIVECPCGCGHQFDAKQHKVGPEKKAQPMPEEDQPPLENYDDIPFS